LRWLLAVVTVCSVAFLILSFGARGQVWAIGASIGLLSLVIVILVHGFTFFLVWLFAQMTGRRKRRAAEKAAGALLVALTCATGYAAGTAHSLPLNGKPAKNGMTLVVDTTWADGFGYRPVTFKVTCTPPASFDRTLSFDFRYHGWNSNATAFKITTDLEVPAGATAVSKTIAAPEFSLWQSYSLETKEDGRRITSLSAEGLGAATGWRGSAGTMPAIVFVGAKQPDAQGLTPLFPQPNYVANPAQNTPIISFFPEWASVPTAALPESWRCYQGLDLLFISLPDIKSLQQKSPKVLTAIRAWVRSGGNLVVYGTGGDLKPIDEMLLQPGKVSDEELSRWQDPKPRDYSHTLVDYVSPFAQQVTVDEVDENGNPVVKAKPKVTAPPDWAAFKWKVVQQGVVVAIENADPFNPAKDGKGFTAVEWNWLFNTLGSSRWLASKRDGMSFTEDNPDFWKFQIPGVGVAPVDTYRVLITAFVVVIGPVNYYLLRKKGRLHLLLFTVPVSALIVTVALLGYALLADGLYTRARSRSLTLLDQRSGQAVAWSRLAYYSGLAPSGGLRFSNDTAVIPFEYIPQGVGGPQVTRVSDAEEDHQQLTHGWLPSRTPTQLVTVCPYLSKKSLKVSSRENQAITVANQLGVPIRHLLVCDAESRFGYGANIKVDGQTTLQDVTVTEEKKSAAKADKIVDSMRKAFADQALVLPDGFVNESRYGLFGIRQQVYYAMRGGSTSPAQSTSRLELGIDAAKSAVNHAGKTKSAYALTPRSYIALVDRPEEISYGLDEVTELEGFHVIRGTW
jgi:hypothetical protein